jgi:hypothetical protein
MIASWDKVVDIDKMSIAIADGTKEAQLYGNGKHQIAIIVTVTPIALDGTERKELKLDPDDMQPSFKLIDYETGKVLPHKSSPDGAEWVWAASSNGFPRNVPDYRDNHIIFYVMTGQRDISKSIAVQVTLTNGAVYSTAKDSKNTQQDSVLLHAKSPLDYSKPELWEVIDGTFNDVSRNMLVESSVRSDGILGLVSENFNGLSRWKKVLISRRRDSAPGKLSTYPEQRWVEGATVGPNLDSANDTINLAMKKPCQLTFRGKPNAVLSWGGANADALFWYVEPSASFGVTPDSKLAFVAANHCYHFVIRPQDNSHSQKPDAVNDQSIAVYLWNLRIPDDSIRAAGWKDTLNDAYVYVVDTYGNNGKLKIIFNESWVPQLT